MFQKNIGNTNTPINISETAKETFKALYLWLEAALDEEPAPEVALIKIILTTKRFPMIIISIMTKIKINGKMAFMERHSEPRQIGWPQKDTFWQLKFRYSFFDKFDEKYAAGVVG